ncbi:MAG: DUF2318 domain-containing protein [Nitrospirae bacterium]|nr:DUF2318 domain-containing protein [Nitrospirota bacterium]
MITNRIYACALAALLALVMASVASCAKARDKGAPVMPEGGVFRIDASGIGRNEVRFFRYETGGKDVVFFVARSPQGDIKTAFDACITCYPHKRGYRQEEDCVVCIFCDTPFRIEELEQGKGNCVPIRIEHTLDGDSVVIERSAIEAGAAWF